MKKLNEIKTYTVWDSDRGKTFATEKEAKKYEKDYHAKTGIFLNITAGSKRVTHSYK